MSDNKIANELMWHMANGVPYDKDGVKITFGVMNYGFSNYKANIESDLNLLPNKQIGKDSMFKFNFDEEE